MYYTMQDIAEFARRKGSRDKQKRKSKGVGEAYLRGAGKGALIGGGLGVGISSVPMLVPKMRNNYVNNIAQEAKDGITAAKYFNRPKTTLGKAGLLVGTVGGVGAILGASNGGYIGAVRHILDKKKRKEKVTW